MLMMLKPAGRRLRACGLGCRSAPASGRSMSTGAGDLQAPDSNGWFGPRPVAAPCSSCSPDSRCVAASLGEFEVWKARSSSGPRARRADRVALAEDLRRGVRRSDAFRAPDIGRCAPADRPASCGHGLSAYELVRRSRHNCACPSPPGDRPLLRCSRARRGSARRVTHRASPPARARRRTWHVALRRTAPGRSRPARARRSCAGRARLRYELEVWLRAVAERRARAGRGRPAASGEP